MRCAAIELKWVVRADIYGSLWRTSSVDSRCCGEIDLTKVYMAIFRNAVCYTAKSWFRGRRIREIDLRNAVEYSMGWLLLLSTQNDIAGIPTASFVLHS